MNKFQNDKISEMARIFLSRLEKISADSAWAHQASGVRASIAKFISREQFPLTNSAKKSLKQLLDAGFDILEKAAREIPEDQQ